MSRRINVGRIDRLLRFIFAGVLLALSLLENPILSGQTPRTIVGIFALIPLATAIFRYCPLYSLIGINTCAKS